MTTNDLLEALARLRVETGSLACLGCGREHNCSTKGCRILREAADLIRQLTAENADLGKEIEWKDMVIALAQREQAKAEAERDALLEIAKQGKDCKTCKNNEVCAMPGIDGAHRCDRCVEKCPCYGCEGGHWEWRGLPGAPEEGDHHEPKT